MRSHFCRNGSHTLVPVRWINGDTAGRRCLNLVAAAATVLLCVESSVARGEGREWRTLIDDDMESGVSAWTQAGNAVFGHERGKGRESKAAARIAVVAPAYQQMSRTLSERVFAGDRYRASAWVRTEGVTEQPGAYIYLEFLREGKRQSIIHSKTGAANGREEWSNLEVEGMAPEGCDSVRVGMVLHAKGTAWFDGVKLETDGKPAQERTVKSARIRIDGGNVTNPDFRGFGFHVFFPIHIKQLTARIKNEVLYKRWLELRPSFARMTHEWNRGDAGLAELVAAMRMMQKSGTVVYLTTWDPKATPPGSEREAYARQVVDMLEHLRRQGCTNLLWYCLTNELQMNGDLGNGIKVNGWASLRSHLDIFRDYHRLFHEELARRKLDVGLLATDASPSLGISENKWARQNMDDISAAYGGHHYINDRGLSDMGLYDWFLGQCRTAAAIAPDKPYIIGEFGSKQHGGQKDGFKRWDGCKYYDTPEEPLVAIQIAEAVLAGVNGGVDALGYWTFSDFPDDYDSKKAYANKWGVSRWSGEDHSTRDLYYGAALLTRNLRGPCEVLQTVSSDPKMRTACVRRSPGVVSLVVVNRNAGRTPVRIEYGAKGSKSFRKYVFDPSRPPQHPFGDLPGPDATIEVKDGGLADELAPTSLVVYTTDYDETPPAAVKDVRVEKGSDGRGVLRWSHAPDADVCYYRVFSGTNQLGSTVAAEFDLKDGVAVQSLRVVAVDTSGNGGR